MKNCNNILFDLDGTLLDTYSGIKRSLENAFEANGVCFDGDYRRFIGPPLQTAFREILGLTDEDIKKVYSKQRKLYDTALLYDFSVYPGIAELLEALSGAGKRVYVVTSKLEAQAKRMLERASLLQRFTALFGQAEDGSRLHKLDVMRFALEAGALAPADCVMIGDRHFDINAAKHFGMKNVAVLYGYAELDELSACGPDGIAENTAELLEMLL